MNKNRKGFISTLLLGLVALVITSGVVFISAKLGYEKKLSDLEAKIQVIEKGKSFTFGTATVTSGNNYPTSSYIFSDNDIINAGDFNNITTFLGTRNSTDSTSVSYQAFNPNIASSTGSISVLASTTGQLPISKGGTATSTAPANSSQFLGANNAVPTWKTLVAGSGVTIATSTTSTTISSPGVDTSANFTWTGGHTFSGGVTSTGAFVMSGTSTFSGPATFNATSTFNNYPIGLSRTLVFVASTTWVVPSGVSVIDVIFIGGGGGGGDGGGGSAGSPDACGGGGGGGGGSGGYERELLNVTAGNSYPIVIGLGGATSTAGQTTSGFGVSVTGGGGGGVGVTAPAGGCVTRAGGTAGIVSTPNGVAGVVGVDGIQLNPGEGGPTGSNYTFANVMAGGVASCNANGSNGTSTAIMFGYGGSGGGGGCGGSTVGGIGAIGRQGAIIIKY